jgi:hypothetical protein
MHIQRAARAASVRTPSSVEALQSKPLGKTSALRKQTEALNTHWRSENVDSWSTRISAGVLSGHGRLSDAELKHFASGALEQFVQKVDPKGKLQQTSAAAGALKASSTQQVATVVNDLGLSHYASGRSEVEQRLAPIIASLGPVKDITLVHVEGKSTLPTRLSERAHAKTHAFVLVNRATRQQVSIQLVSAES